MMRRSPIPFVFHLSSSTMKEAHTAMNHRTITRRFGAIAITLGALALAGCATFAPLTPEKIVEKRASEFWQARITGNFEKAYALSTPAYRQLKTADQFRLQFGAGVSVQAAEVASVVCEPQRCTARVKLSAQPLLIVAKLGTIPVYIDDIWLLEDGQWWHYQEP